MSMDISATFMSGDEKTQRNKLRAALLRRISAGIARALAVPAGVAVLALLVLVCANAGGRALEVSLRGAVESSGVLGGVAAALALSYAQGHRDHIAGGVAAERLPRCLRMALHVFSLLCGILFFAAAAYEMADLALFSLECGETVDGLGEYYPYMIALTVPGFAGQALMLCCSLGITLLQGGEA